MSGTDQDGHVTRMSIPMRLNIFFRGKNIAILGPTASGKTTLYNYLENGSVSIGESDHTVAPRRRGGLYRTDYALICRKGYDVSGLSDSYDRWQELAKRADILFYLFDAHRVRTDQSEYAVRVGDDSRMLRELGLRRKNVLVLGTHRDQDPLSHEVSNLQYRKVITDLDAVEALRSRLGYEKFGLGELRDDTGVKELLRQVLP